MKYFFLIVALVLGLTAYFSWKTTPPPTSSPASTGLSETSEKPVRAAFLIYTNGIKRTFTSPMYHDRSPVAYITANRPEIVHVSEPQITWGQFFDTLPMKLTQECLMTGTGETYCTGDNGTLRFFLNDQETEDALTRPIASDDRLLVTYGLTTELDLAHQKQAVPYPSALDTPAPSVEQ